MTKISMAEFSSICLKKRNAQMTMRLFFFLIGCIDKVPFSFFSVQELNKKKEKGKKRRGCKKILIYIL